MLLWLMLVAAPNAVRADDAASDDVVFQTDASRLSLGLDGRVHGFARLDGATLLAAEKGCPLMLVRIGTKWHESNSMAASDHEGGKLLRVGFNGVKVSATVIVRAEASHVAVETVGLEGEDADKVEQWSYVNLPVNIRDTIGGWLNVAWNPAFAVGVLALDECTEASGTPTLRASAHRGLGFGGRKAAIVACPTPQVLSRIEGLEQQYGLPSPKLGGQWNKKSQAARRSWMITSLTMANTATAFQPEKVFETAKQMGVGYVVVSLRSWEAAQGHYDLNRHSFPDGVDSLKKAADMAHAAGLKLGIHVMSASISKHDPYATPKPDARLQKEGEVTLAADIDAAATDIPTIEAPTGFGTATGYWARGGVDVQIDDELISYGAVRTDAPFGLAQCVRGAGKTVAAPHKAGAKVQRLAERYGWYIANPELAVEIGRNLAGLIDRAGLDMVCFDGADIPYVAQPSLQYYFGHQVAASILRHVHRDVLLSSNGTTHFGWHVMARGGEEDAMALGYQRWVDDRTVHVWGQMHVTNFLVPDFSWVGVFPRTDVLKAARPDDVELICARSLGYDGVIGWGFAACFGGPSNVETFQKNGRNREIAEVARTYEQLRLDNGFSRQERQPLCEARTHWHLLPQDAADGRRRIVQASYPTSDVLRSTGAEATTWLAENPFGAQPLRLRIEALASLSPYGSKDNVILADFAESLPAAGGLPASKSVVERTDEPHAAAGAVARFACAGPAPDIHFPKVLTGHGQTCWAEARRTFPKPLDLRQHRAVGLWVHGDAGGEVLDVRLEFGEAAYLHYFLPITFSGWKYCELGEPDGDRVMDYFSYDKFAMHDVALDHCVGLTLAVLVPPEDKDVSLQIGRIEALHEVGGSVVHPRVTVGNVSLTLPVTLQPGQYVETGDLWGGADSQLCRVFDADGQELERSTLQPAVPTLPSGKLPLRFDWQGDPPGRLKATLLLLDSAK